MGKLCVADTANYHNGCSLGVKYGFCISAYYKDMNAEHKYVCTLSAEQKVKAEIELNESELWRERDIQILRDKVLDNKGLYTTFVSPIVCYRDCPCSLNCAAEAAPSLTVGGGGGRWEVDLGLRLFASRTRLCSH